MERAQFILKNITLPVIRAWLVTHLAGTRKGHSERWRDGKLLGFNFGNSVGWMDSPDSSGVLELFGCYTADTEIGQIMHMSTYDAIAALDVTARPGGKDIAVTARCIDSSPAVKPARSWRATIRAR